MLHIAAGVFLGLIAYTIAMGWWAGRPQRRADRLYRREIRRIEREKQRLEQEALRREQARQREARPPRTSPFKVSLPAPRLPGPPVPNPLTSPTARSGPWHWFTVAWMAFVVAAVCIMVQEYFASY